MIDLNAVCSAAAITYRNAPCGNERLHRQTRDHPDRLIPLEDIASLGAAFPRARSILDNGTDYTRSRLRKKDSGHQTSYRQSTEEPHDERTETP